MLSFFRINDPYRILFVFLLLLVFRLPYIIVGLPLTLPEIEWMIVGEAMANGKMMYGEIWDDLGPLSALTYQIVDWVFGKSQLAYQLLSLTLVFLQAAIFNRLLLINKAYNENTYVPAFVYVICMSANFEFLTLSPVLMSTTFVLLAINNIFKRIDNLTLDELFLNTGLYLGIAALFYFPSVLFLVSTLLSLILFTSAVPRRLLLLVFGFTQIIVVALLYYYWFDAAKDFYFQFFRFPFEAVRDHFLNGTSLFASIAVLIVFFILSLIKLYSKIYYVNYQVKFQSVMMLTLLCSGISLFLVRSLSASNLILLIPPGAFFISHLLLLTRRKLRAEMILYSFIFLIFGYQFVIVENIKGVGQIVDFSKLYVPEKTSSNKIDGNKLLVLGNEMSLYEENTLATPYLNWQLSLLHFDQLNYYDVLTDVFNNFNGDPPEVIIDLEDRLPGLFEKMPAVGMKYRKSGNTYFIKE
ncbi:MAG: hypothetical protein O2887_04295 [Bacteroidetes bacterium]|nr:hypothetical protein [Bacteroidota bacterium]MDA1119705.1 hypothetical protein [Bacteroidota bacterium]